MRNKMIANPFATNNFIDSCAFDPKYFPEDTNSLELLEYNNQYPGFLKIAHSTQKEIDHPNTPKWVKAEAYKMIYTLPVSLTTIEQTELRTIETIIAGTGKIKNIKADAYHIFEAQKYGNTFITTDKRLLAKRSELKAFKRRINILKPSELLDMINKAQTNKLLTVP